MSELLYLHKCRVVAVKDERDAVSHAYRLVWQPTQEHFDRPRVVPPTQQIRMGREDYSKLS